MQDRQSLVKDDDDGKDSTLSQGLMTELTWEGSRPKMVRLDGSASKREACKNETTEGMEVELLHRFSSTPSVYNRMGYSGSLAPLSWRSVQCIRPPGVSLHPLSTCRGRISTSAGGSLKVALLQSRHLRHRPASSLDRTQNMDLREVHLRASTARPLNSS
ncbi:hypothetical protein SRHO_G00176660 [Serrasalmus rhombeus]